MKNQVKYIKEAVKPELTIITMNTIRNYETMQNIARFLIAEDKIEANQLFFLIVDNSI
jgi:hypothetical protein